MPEKTREHADPAAVKVVYDLFYSMPGGGIANCHEFSDRPGSLGMEVEDLLADGVTWIEIEAREVPA